MRAFPWLLGGGAAAIVFYYWMRRERGKSGASEKDAPLPGHWVWPVGVWHGRKPEISDGFSSMRHMPDGHRMPHGGVDIMYRRQAGDPWVARTAHGTRNFVMPDDRAALAASDGVVTFAANTPRGWTVILDHSPRKLTTYYTHLSLLLVTAKQEVTAGTPLGIIGADPLDHDHLMHLHFEVRRGGSHDQIDPQPFMMSWEYVPDLGDLPRSLVARNSGHRSRDGSSYSVPVRPHYRRSPRR